MITTEAKRKYNAEYYAARPWKRRHDSIVARCRKGRYADRGIKNFLELVDVEYLWVRDRAYRLRQPSIDRIDNDGHYTLNNCQFIEKGENSRKDKIGKKRGPQTQEWKDNISKSMKCAMKLKWGTQ